MEGKDGSPAQESNYSNSQLADMILSALGTSEEDRPAKKDKLMELTREKLMQRYYEHVLLVRGEFKAYSNKELADVIIDSTPSSQQTPDMAELMQLSREELQEPFREQVAEKVTEVPGFKKEFAIRIRSAPLSHVRCEKLHSVAWIHVREHESSTYLSSKTLLLTLRQVSSTQVLC
jgi:hypothetical protein